VDGKNFHDNHAISLIKIQNEQFNNEEKNKVSQKRTNEQGQVKVNEEKHQGIYQ